MLGNEDHHRQGRRFAAGGNGRDGRDPRDVEIERLRDEEEEYPSFDSYPQSFEPIYPDIFLEDEPRFDEEEVVNSDYEESPVFDDDQYEAETENIFGSIFTFDDIERNEGEKGLVKGDGPTVVTGGPVASMATLPFVPKVQVGLLVEARFTNLNLE
nr:hypothetical protein [Tanacetum cinerariifolium]